MAASETPNTTNSENEVVSLRYVGECSEGNCDFAVDCGNEAVAHRTAGRHEGNNDLTHQVDIRVVVDD